MPQVEAIVIVGVLAHVFQRERHMVICTDSRAAITSLPNDNIYLLTTVLSIEHSCIVIKPHRHLRK